MGGKICNAKNFVRVEKKANVEEWKCITWIEPICMKRAWSGYNGVDLAQALDTSIVDQVASRTSTWQENGESKESMSF